MYFSKSILGISKNTYKYFIFQDPPKKNFLGGLRPPIVAKPGRNTL